MSLLSQAANSAEGRPLSAQSTDTDSARLGLGVELQFSPPDLDAKTTMTIYVPDSPGKGWITIQMPVAVLEAIVVLLQEYRPARTTELPATIQGRVVQ